MSASSFRLRRWRYEMGGSDGSGAAFSVAGELESGAPLQSVAEEAQRLAFSDLTQGKARYGYPGQGGCRGPYRITKLLVEEII